MEVEEVARQEVVETLADIQCQRPNVTKGQTARIQTILPTKVLLIIEQTNSIRITLHTAEMQIRQPTQGVGGEEWIKRVHREFNHMLTKRIQIRDSNNEHKGLRKRTKTVQTMIKKSPVEVFLLIENQNSLLNVERILPLFRNNPQFMQKVGVEVNGVPRVCVSVLSLSVFALAGVVEFINNVP